METEEETIKQCGEVFLKANGNIIFHCTLCENKYNGFEEYAAHINEHYLIIKEELEEFVSDDNEECILPMPVDCENEEKPTTLPEMPTTFYEIEEINLVEDHTESANRDSSETSLEKCDNIETKSGVEMVKRRRVAKRQQNNSKAKSEKEKPHSCAHCDYRTNIKSKMEEHIRRHFGDRPFKCLICEKGFYTQNEKTRHTARTHPESIEDSKLPSAEKLEVKKLIKSSKIKLGENQFQCKECGLICEGESIIWSHIRRHSTYKPHQCTLCPKQFYTRTELDTHVRSHTGEKPYLCTECGNAFSTSSKLTIHLKRHKNIRDKECPTCQRRFFNINQLRNHMAVHSEERPYSCDVCNSTFKRRKALNNHMKLHLNQRKYECEICDATFNQQAGLLSHIRNKHTMPSKEQDA